MFKLAKRYEDYFSIEKVKGIKKLLFGLMLTLPHIFTCLVFILIYPSQWLGIIIVGLFLPDIYYFLYHIHRKLFPRGPEYPFALVNYSVKTISHIMVFFVVLFLIFVKEPILALAGGLHLLIDLLGF